MADVESQNGTEQIHKLLDELVVTFDQYKHVLRANTVDFFTHNRIELLHKVNPALVNELRKLTQEDLVKVACGKFDCSEKGSYSSLTEISKLSQQASISCESLGRGLSFKNSASYIQACSEHSESNDTVIVKPKEFMNLKKSHEVEEMSHLCSWLCRSLCLDQVIDIGSGKGYLSQYLTLQYGLQVIGIDSSDTNTHGAKERSRKLTRHWKAFLRRAAEEKKKDGTVSTTKQGKLIDKQMLPDSCDNLPSHDPAKVTIEERCKTSVLSSDRNRIELQQESLGISSTDHTDLQTHMAEGYSKNSDKYADVKGHTSSFQPVTAFVSSATDLTHLAGTIADGDMEGNLQQSDPFLLVGLHTCGDLAATITKLFIDCPSAKAMCYVPCCYHFVSEEFEPRESRFWIEPPQPDQWGFPMSCYLKSKMVNIGRDAKMLACLAPERMDANGELPVRSLYFRALLQVLLKEHYRIPTREEVVGKLANKCKDFVEYTRRALTKLGFDPNKLSDEEINQYNLDYSEKTDLLKVFTVARLAFSRMVESLLHIDKVCFLLEQPLVRSAVIVKLFDAVQSPRCYAIVAIKDSPR